MLYLFSLLLVSIEGTHYGAGYDASRSQCARDANVMGRGNCSERCERLRCRASLGINVGCSTYWLGFLEF